MDLFVLKLMSLYLFQGKGLQVCFYEMSVLDFQIFLHKHTDLLCELYAVGLWIYYFVSYCKCF